MSKEHDVFEQFLLYHFAAAKRLTVLELARRTLPGRLDAVGAKSWQIEIELACELMVLRRLLRVEYGAGGRIYVATERALAMLPPPPGRLRACAVALSAAMLFNACATRPAGTSYYEAPASRVRPYHEAVEPPPLARMEQFPIGSGAVYRFCTDDCPQPTMKRPALAQFAPIQSPAAPAASAPPPAVARPAVETLPPLAKALTLQTMLPNTSAKETAPLPDPLRTAVVKQLQGLQQQVKEHGETPVLPQQRDNPASGLAHVQSSVPDPDALARSSGIAAEARGAPAPLLGEPQPPIAVQLARAAQRVGNALATPAASSGNAAAVVRSASGESGRIAPHVSRSGEGALPLETAGTNALVTTSLPAPADAARLAQSSDGLMQTQTRTESEPPELSPREFLNTWANAWAARDVKTYFRLYAADFVAPDGVRAAIWQARRAAIMTQASDIEVSLEIMSVHVSAEHASLRFWQRYRSPTFRSRVLKSIDLVKHQGAWKIRAERVVTAV